MSEEYNGWTNYETWAVGLWLSNDYGSYMHWSERAETLKEEAPENDMVERGIWTAEECRRYLLAKEIKNEVMEANPLGSSASLFSDLTGAALSSVDWNEIAVSFIEE